MLIVRLKPIGFNRLQQFFDPAAFPDASGEEAGARLIQCIVGARRRKDIGGRALLPERPDRKMDSIHIAKCIVGLHEL